MLEWTRHNEEIQEFRDNHKRNSMNITNLVPDSSGLVTWPTLSVNRKSVVTVGSFDGMHNGHRAVIGRTVELANANDAFSVVILFTPRPGVIH